MGQHKRIVIVGGGVIGLCTAYYCLKQGHHVTVLERDAPDYSPASFGNAGMIVPSHFVPLAAPGMLAYGLRMMLKSDSPFAVTAKPNFDLLRWGLLFAQSANAHHVTRSAPLLRDLHEASRTAYQDLTEELNDDFGLTRRGLLMLFKTKQALMEETHAVQMACKLGVDAQVLTPQEASEIDSEIAMDITGAVYYPGDAHLTPQRFMKCLTNAILANGGEIRWGVSVTDWRSNNGKIEAVQTNQGDVSGDEFVLANGIWAVKTARLLGLNLPMQSGKGYSFTLKTPRQLPRICSLLMEARVAVTPMDSALRFGGTMEIGGLPNSISERRVQGIKNAIPEYFPEFQAKDFDDLPIWSGLRPCSPDGLPYLGRFARFANLSAATGHAMMGMSLGPVSGQIMANLLSDEPIGFDLNLLRPDRY